MFEGVAERISVPGAVGVIPTDTVYGIVARASDEAAVARLYRLKQRDRKPGTVIAASVEDFVALGIERRHLDTATRFWPGPVSVALPDREPSSERQPAIRIPDHEALRALLRMTGPLMTSSANQPGEPPATTFTEAEAYFGDAVDFYIDGGDLSGRAPSTIIKITDDGIEVIREGAVKIQGIAQKSRDKDS